MNRAGWLIAVGCLLFLGCSSGGAASDSGFAQPDENSDQGPATQPDSRDTAPDAATCPVPCGADCCATTAVCLIDQSGNRACAPACNTSSDCQGHGNAACCVALTGGGGACVNPATGTYECLCKTASDCTAATVGGPACVPVVSGDHVASKAHACGPDDGVLWHGCNTTTCASGSDCWLDGGGNKFCTNSCNEDATCGNPGTACCVMPPAATCSNALLSCSGSGGCMPCP